MKTKEKKPRCEALLPNNFILNRKAGQCRKRAHRTIETRIGFTIYHNVCNSEECATWIYSGHSVNLK